MAFDENLNAFVQAQSNGYNPYGQLASPGGAGFDTSFLNQILPSQYNPTGFGKGMQQGSLLDMLSKIQTVAGTQALSSLGLQQQLLPLFANQELNLMGQIAPGQQQFAAGQLKDQLGLLSGTPFGDALGAGKNVLSSAFDPLKEIAGPELQSQLGIDALLKGQLPEGVSSELLDALGSVSERTGLAGSPFAAQELTKAYGSNLSNIRENLLQSREQIFQGRNQLAQSMSSARVADALRLNSFGLSGLDTFAGVGLPDIGLGPIGFQGSAGIVTGQYGLLQQGKENKLASQLGKYNVESSIFNSLASQAPKAPGFK